jgi:hypothetical protein
MRRLQMKKCENDGLVVIRFGYGLGTQMFYYALYRALQIKGINVYLDDWFWRKMERKPHETYKLDYFGIFENDLNIMKFEEYKDLIDIGLWTFEGKYYKNKNKLLFYHYLKRAGILIHKCLNIEYKIKDTYYIERLVKKPIPVIDKTTRIYLQGILQSYKYCENIRDNLLDEYSFNLKIQKNVENYLDDIRQNNSVSISLRRGDFVGNKDLDICTMRYYNNAINYIQERKENVKFYIFTNDIDYAKAYFSFLKNKIIIDNTKERYADYCDLFLLKNTKYNIICNSSFAWWGAWLNCNPQKIVIVPEIWRGTNKYFVDPDYIYPPEWIRLGL